MPNRIIRESVCTSDSIDGLSWFEEVLFYRLIVSCDDFGRYDGRAAIIKNRLFPLKDNLTLKTVENALHGLASAGLVVFYMSQDKRFLYLPTWGKYQSQRAKESKYPAPVTTMQADEIICKQAQADVSVFENRYSRIDIRESKCAIRESRSESKTRGTRFAPPTLDEVQAYIAERGSSVDAQRFIDFYASKGWMVGKNPMKDWKAAVRTWDKRDNYETAPRAGWKPERKSWAELAAEMDAEEGV